MGKIKCNCGGIFEEQAFDFDGSDVKGLKCDKCGELTFTPDQFKKVFC